MNPSSTRWGLHLSGGVATARLWAPSAQTVDLVFEDGRTSRLAPEPGGWHGADVDGVRPGDHYMFAVDGFRVPDPASRFQPGGPFAWSEVVDLQAYVWREAGWAGRPWAETVLYELHVGTFTPEGTYAAAERHLDHLARLGVTMVELMPVATFPGRRNWGYDGVLPFAPDPTYGRPEDLQRLVDACHARGLSVILDVVYNHFGPEGNFLGGYAREFFTERHHTPWGAAINFDGAQSAAVRAFYVQNAIQWLRDYRFDGLRLDAVQAILDDSTPHLLEELSTRVRQAVPGRRIHLTLENDFNEARWLGGTAGTAMAGASPPGAAPADTPAGLYQGQWNDDFHHVMRVLTTGQVDGYYEDYADDPVQYLGRALTEGFSYQGQESKHRPGMMRGTPSGHLPPTAFINFVQNHDQVGNSAYGRRLAALAPAPALRLAAAVLLLAPGIPMLFMGEEWAAGTPFDFFCDFDEPLAAAVRTGRRGEFKRFKEFQTEGALAKLADPTAEATRDASCLDWAEPRQPAHAEALAFHTRLLRLRAERIVPLLEGMGGHAGTFRTLSDRAIEVRWTAPGAVLVMAANFSDDGMLYDAPDGEVLVALGEAGPGGLAGWGFRLALCPGQRST